MLLVLLYVGEEFVLPALFYGLGAASEATAISMLRNIVTSQITYQATVGQGSFALDLAALSAQKLIDRVLGSGTRDGYVFTLSGYDSTFTAAAAPQVPGETGNRYFFADESGVLRYRTTGLPTASFNPL